MTQFDGQEVDTFAFLGFRTQRVNNGTGFLVEVIIGIVHFDASAQTLSVQPNLKLYLRSKRPFSTHLL